MKGLKILFYVYFIVFSIVFVNSLGVWNEDEYVVFTNNLNPIIKINITNPSGPIDVIRAILIVDSNENFTIDINERVFPNQVASYIFSLEDFGIIGEINWSTIDFDLISVDADNRNVEILDGSEPMNFDLIMDEEPPIITSISPSFGNTIKIKDFDEIINIEFSEKIRSYKLTSNGSIIKTQTNNAQFWDMYLEEFEFRLPSNLEFVNNITKVSLEFEDLAGNINKEDYDLVLVGDELKVDLITRKDDSNLNYFYNSSLKELFGTTIYSNLEKFNLVVKTNLPSNCYFANNLFSFKQITDSHTRVLAQTTDNLMHTISVDSVIGPKIWVACQKIIDPQDVVYLSEILFDRRDLVDIEFYNSKLEIQEVIPRDLITNKIFDIYLKTNQNSICKYQINSKKRGNLKFNDGNLKEHFFLNEEVINEGTHTLNLSCVDVLGDYVKLQRDFKLNLSQGVKIMSYEPKYYGSVNEILSFRISTPADCRYVPSNKIIATNSSFFSLTKAQGTNLDYSIRLPSNLEIGENILTFSCLKAGQLFNGEKIKITFDPNGPSLKELKFENNGIKSDYVSSFEEIEYSLEVDSIAAVNKYFISVFTNNGTQKFEKNSKNSKIKGDFENANKIQIIGRNINGKNSSPIEKTLSFDFNPPQISFTKQGDEVTIVCVDIENECINIEYGFSQTAIDCNPAIDYDLGEIIPTKNRNYICAQATDKVGLYVKEQIQVGTNNFGDFNEDDFINNNNTFEDNIIDLDNEDNSSITFEENGFEDDNNEEEFVEDVPFNPEGFDNQSNQENNTVPLIAAIVTLLGGLGGGGYYAYKKGYLNESLNKLGLGKKQNNNVDNKSQNSLSSFTNSNNKKDSSINNNKKGSYEDHYKKLNSFLDRTLDNKKGVFKDFDKSNKGKVKGYEDTLLKNNKKKVSSKEEFDEFYSSSKEASLKDAKSLEKEAEEFESYHKNKKQNNKKKD